MTTPYKGSPLGLTEIGILAVILIILGYVFIPRIHDYFYQQTAAEIVNHYEKTIAKVSAGIKNTPSGEIGYFLRTKKHKGMINAEDTDTAFKPDLDSTYRYSIGTFLKKSGVIYFSVNTFFIPVRLRIVAHYFKLNPELLFLEESLSITTPPLAEHLHNQQYSSTHTPKCKGYPIILTIGMNFKLKHANRYTVAQIRALLKKDGYTVNNYTVRSTFNAYGNVCSA